MNTRRTIGQRREGATVGGNQGPPKAPTEGVVMPVNPPSLTDVEVRGISKQDGTGHHNGGSRYDCPSQLAGCLEKESTSSQDGLHIERFHEDESYYIRRV